MTDTPAATYETPDEAKKPDERVKMWLDALALAANEEEKWRDKANGARERYRDEKARGAKARRYNILYANTETYVPAVFNNTPVPDVRRRFRDTDPVGKVGAQIIERALAYTVDAYDFDGEIVDTVHDNALAGRGVARVRYIPLVQDGTVAWQSVECEHVQWDRFRHGPGRRYRDWPWVAFLHYLTRDELIEKFDAIGAKVNLTWVQEGASKVAEGEPPKDTFKRAPVWEIWDKGARKVLFLSEGLPSRFLKEEDDPLRLSSFFPIPRPLHYVEDSASSVPIVPYELYRDQAEELDRITRRITALVSVLRWRGIAPGSISSVLTALANADDGDILPADEVTAIMAEGGLEKNIWLMPIDKLGAVITGLYEQREQIKAVIYEITGIADIMRGQTKASETLGAQRIKAEWGSLRVRRHQREVARFCRDIFRLMSEIISEHFEPDTLALMTGTKLPNAQVKQLVMQAKQMAMQTGQEPQLPPQMLAMADYPTWEEVMEVLRSDGLRSFRIDVESDSTIQIELGVAQENAANFMQGFAQFGAAVGPAVEAGVMPMDVVTDLFSSFARMFKLGRQAEDAIERMTGDRDPLGLGEMPKPQQKPDPAAEAAAMDAQTKQQELKIREQEVSTKAQLEMIRAETERLDKLAAAQRAERELALKEKIEPARLLMDAAKADQEGARADRQMQVDGMIRASDTDAKREDMAERRGMDREINGKKVDLDERRFGEERKAKMAERGSTEGEDGEEVSIGKAIAVLSKAVEALSGTAKEQLALSKASRADAERILKGL